MKRIAIFDAQPEMILAKEVLSRTGRLLIRRGESLNKQRIRKLIEFGIPTLYIEDGSDFYEDTVLKDDVTEIPDIISAETRDEAERVVQELMNDVKAGHMINTHKVKYVVDDIVDELIRNRFIATKLADIRILDDYTFAHSVNVCVLSVSTGIVLGYPKHKLEKLAIGAILHDIGKMLIPEEILNKPGELTKSEFEEMKKHALLGYELLKEQPEVPATAALVALQHHECFNGEGYPYGIKNENIHEHSRIVAVADVYDALTADRVYKNAVLPYECVEIIIASSGYKFDPKIVRTFVENVSIYPIGTVVELNTGEMAAVIDSNRILPTRPTVMIIADKNKREVQGGAEVDLMNNPTVFITRIKKLKRCSL
jgi:HD-GYP domain-containing protein (c-di-GMP phosphodiesterase class II)